MEFQFHDGGECVLIGVVVVMVVVVVVMMVYEWRGVGGDIDKVGVLDEEDDGVGGATGCRRRGKEVAEWVRVVKEGVGWSGVIN